MLKLLSSATSPYVRKVLVCAHEIDALAHLQLQPVKTLPTANDAALVPHNPLAKIPTLIFDDGRSLFDSHVICDYLDHHFGKGCLIPSERRYEVLRNEALADGILDAALLMRYETFLRPAALQWPEWIAAQELKVVRGLDEMQLALSQHDAASLDLGTISCAVTLGYLDFRFAGLMWRDGRESLASWYAQVSQRPSLRSTVPHE